MRDLQGKTALITGASRGIGLGIAQRLVAEGARVCLTARKPEALEAAVASLGGPEHAIAVPGKADDPAHQEEAVAAAIAAFGSLEILVNNAGINPAYGPMLELDPAAFRKVFDVNVIGTLGWVRAAHRASFGEHGGSVVNVASVAGLGPAAGIGAYAASKAALIQLTAQLADELSPLVRVNAVAPAVVKTSFAAALYEGREEKVAAGYALGRLGVPEDVAGAVAFLASADAGWITGQTLVVDGGLLLKAGV
ncbi:SDR family oxidoreductase [Actinospica durhamensis]|uniref:SDR family oxidoreductase n=1 Tax=Actinospica durhamensis TaxID=1508375 RepID=A0A941EJI6_9ACTN|nr:SDR family oxidoreductase [Actinospica durhamensis]MBR7832712.1 SDR family oxidoreductase [Actinospica durhamensis]